MKLKLSIIISIFLVAQVLQAQQVHKVWEPPYEQGIAAQVEDRIITFEEIRRQMAPLTPRIREESGGSETAFQQKMSALYVEIMQNIIDKEIILKEFRYMQEEKGMQIPATVVSDEFDRVLIEDFNNDRAAFLEHLKSQGKNTREFQSDLRETIIVSVMRSQMRKNVSEVSPERIESFYNENKIHFFEEESVKLRVILVKAIGAESTEAVQAKLDKVLEELKSDKSFKEVASEYSQDANKSSGGDWGWVTRSDLQDDLGNAVFDLEEETYSEPINLSNNYYILYCEKYREEGIQPLTEVRDRIENILVGQISRQAQKAWIERLRKNAYIKYY